MSDKQLVGFVGLGIMGTRMSRHVIEGGYDVLLYDAMEGVAAKLAAEIGGTPVADARELARASIIVTMLPTSAIVRSVFLTEDGALTIPLQPGTVIIDMSSSDPTETIETGRQLLAHGVHLVDAPVSGGQTRAADGTLTIMLGADDEDAARRAIPVIETMSQGIFRTGKLGTGDAMKALNNFIAGAAFAATSEALIAGERAGLDRAQMIEIINTSTGQSFSSLKVFGPDVVGERWASGFALPLITKDLRIARDLTRSLGLTSPMVETATSQWETALDALGNVDHSRAYQAWDAK